MHSLGTLNLNDQNLSISHNGKVLFSETRQSLQREWSSTSNMIRMERDTPENVLMENGHNLGENPLMVKLPERPVSEHPAWALIQKYEAEGLPKPRIAILREQGTNGHMEMAAMFALAGFEAEDVHMSDILSGRKDLS